MNHNQIASMLKHWKKDMAWFKLNHPKEYKRYIRSQKLKKKYELS